MRHMLLTFSEMGISQLVAKKYHLTTDDMEMISLISSEQREFEREQKEAQRGEQNG